MFEGIFVPLITPFDEKNKVDHLKLKNLMNFLQDKINGFFILGTYGSTALLTEQEKKAIIDQVIKNKENQKIIVHVGESNPNISLKLAKYAQNAGVDALAFVPPYFYNYKEEEVVSYFQKIIKEIKIPVFVYLNPSRVGYNLSISCIKELVKIGVYGIKDSTNNLDFFYDLCSNVDLEKFNYLSGSELFLNPTMFLGGKGAISAMANAFPEYVISVYNSIKNNNLEEYQNGMKNLLAYRKVREVGQGIPVVHAILNTKGVDVGYPRFPFKYDDELVKRVKNYLEVLKI